MTLKSREQKLRRHALRQGLIATKGKDSYGLDGWMICNFNNFIEAGYDGNSGYTMSLENAESYIAEEEK